MDFARYLRKMAAEFLQNDPSGKIEDISDTIDDVGEYYNFLRKASRFTQTAGGILSNVSNAIYDRHFSHLDDAIDELDELDDLADPLTDAVEFFKQLSIEAIKRGAKVALGLAITIHKWCVVDYRPHFKAMLIDLQQDTDPESYVNKKLPWGSRLRDHLEWRLKILAKWSVFKIPVDITILGHRFSDESPPYSEDEETTVLEFLIGEVIIHIILLLLAKGVMLTHGQLISWFMYGYRYIRGDPAVRYMKEIELERTLGKILSSIQGKDESVQLLLDYVTQILKVIKIL